MSQRTEVLDLVILHCTDRAVCIQGPGDEDVWIPFSLIHEPDQQTIRDSVGGCCEIEIPNWLADREGLLE